MKFRNYLSLFIAALCTLCIQSCSNDDDAKSPVSPQAESAFNQKYPDAQNVAWRSVSNKYQVASFLNGSTTNDAWFTPDGKWYMTETDIPYEKLPAAVKTAFEQSIYASWTKDDVDMLERLNQETIYVIEVENKTTRNEEEIDLYYSEDGILIKAVPDSEDNPEDYLPIELPEEVTSFINKNYPNSRIVETEIENKILEVEIIQDNVCKEILFDSSYEWLATSWEIEEGLLPAAIKEAIAASEYSAWEIDDVEYTETPNGVFYVIDLELNDKEVTIKMDQDGNFIK